MHVHIHYVPQAYLGGLYWEGGADYYFQADLLSQVEWVLIDNSVCTTIRQHES